MKLPQTMEEKADKRIYEMVGEELEDNINTLLASPNRFEFQVEISLQSINQQEYKVAQFAIRVVAGQPRRQWSLWLIDILDRQANCLGRSMCTMRLFGADPAKAKVIELCPETIVGLILMHEN